MCGRFVGRVKTIEDGLWSFGLAEVRSGRVVLPGVIDGMREVSLVEVRLGLRSTGHWQRWCCPGILFRWGYGGNSHPPASSTYKVEAE